MNEFDFSNSSDEKNIILIGGKNGAGKTSLFTAIKIALYGPLAYGYVGVNPHYIAKIKDCINSKAFQTNKVESSVQINISLLIEREIKEYKIKREWNYSKQKLEETFFVICDGKRLDEQELSYFQNYLQGIIPPDLFEFFLFDGEEVGNIFSTNSYNLYVRNAIYTLCGLDIFEIIRKHTSKYVGKASTNSEAILLKKYKQFKEAVELLEEKKDKAEIFLEGLQKELDKIETDLLELETAFKNKGGITEAERDTLAQEYDIADRTKIEASAKIKNFVENLMPFYIVKDFSGNIASQIINESNRRVYEYIQQKIRTLDIKGVLPDNVPENTVDELMDMLLIRLKPEGFDENTIQLHDLSQESTGRVNAMISALTDFDLEDMIKTVKEKQKAAERTMEIKRILKSAMTDEDAAKYAEKENEFLKKKEEIVQAIYDTKKNLVEINIQYGEKVAQRDKAFSVLKENTQEKNVYELSSRLTAMMETLLFDKANSIKKSLEDMIVKNLQHIYQKNNLITHIEIDENFKFNLYQDTTYSSIELIHLMDNVGKDNFSNMIGKKGLHMLFEKYRINSINELQQFLKFNPNDSIELFKNIDLSRLSKGERQIFILALYWAIIQISNQDIPFIIDTPYARIDANHRKEISEKFFPSISKQVIILSTDEEINEEYYGIIKPYIAKEYLLINNESQNKTTIENRYFFET